LLSRMDEAVAQYAAADYSSAFDYEQEWGYADEYTEDSEDQAVTVPEPVVQAAAVDIVVVDNIIETAEYTGTAMMSAAPAQEPQTEAAVEKTELAPEKTETVQLIVEEEKSVEESIPVIEIAGAELEKKDVVKQEVIEEETTTAEETTEEEMTEEVPAAESVQPDDKKSDSAEEPDTQIEEEVKVPQENHKHKEELKSEEPVAIEIVDSSVKEAEDQEPEDSPAIEEEEEKTEEEEKEELPVLDIGDKPAEESERTEYTDDSENNSSEDYDDSEDYDEESDDSADYNENIDDSDDYVENTDPENNNEITDDSEDYEVIDGSEDDYSDDDSDYEEEPEDHDVASNASLGQEIVDYASGFVGVTPYVWAGDSLEEGTDCSGFTHLIYADFGIDLPTGSDYYQDMGNIGYEDLQPGDIVVYRDGGHVAIYAGDDTIIHCSNEDVGTIESEMFYDTPTAYVRVVE